MKTGWIQPLGVMSPISPTPATKREVAPMTTQKEKKLPFNVTSLIGEQGHSIERVCRANRVLSSVAHQLKVANHDRFPIR